MSRLPKKLVELTRCQAKSALYIDFEGVGKTKSNPNPKPAFLGVLGAEYRAVILEDALSLLTRGKAGFCGDRKIEPCLDAAISELVECAESEQRLILYFSQHERVTIEAHCNAKVARAFRSNSANAKLLIDKWAARSRPKSKPKKQSLAAYCDMVKAPVPCPPKPGLAETICRVGGACRKMRRWSNLAPRYQAQARELFQYNREDCAALRLLTRKAVNYFNTPGEGRCTIDTPTF